MTLATSRTVSDLFGLLEGAPDKAQFFRAHPRVAIYGAGNMGKKVGRLLADAGANVVCFLDQKARPGATFDGIPIYTPDTEALSLTQRQNLSVVIGICNGTVQMPNVVAKIREWGYGSVTTFMEFHHYFEAEIGQHFWLTERNYYAGFQDVLTECSNLWADHSSRQLFLDILEYRLTGNYDVLPQPDLVNQYFAPNVPAWASPLRFVDCGAYNGDTLAQILRADLDLEAAVAFEPDQGNFLELRDYVHRHLETLPIDTSVWPCGVAAETEQLRFSSGDGVSSRLTGTGEIVIQCVALDDVLPQFRPNLIKMDIEGAEMQAILGARQTIMNHRPGLAICLYHHPAHLWQIPLLLKDWQCDYQFYLRSHEFNGFELVMYAIPA